VIIRASSSLTPATTNTVADRLTAIVGSLVDLRNPSSTSLTYTGGGTGLLPSVGCSTQQISPSQGTCSAYQTNGGTGQAITGEANPVTSIAANPGTQVRYKLDVVNTGAVADSFDLSYNVGSGTWNFNGSTNPFVPAQALPAGYTLAFFFDGGSNDCSTVASGAQITNNGVLQPPPAASTLTHKLVCAVLTIPAGAASGVKDLYFRALSPTTTTANTAGNSFDVKHDQLFVNTVRSVTITPNNSGQVFPGGSVSYCHTVTNVGNVIEPSINVADVNNLTSPWSTNSTIYLDTNGNCTLDGTEGSAPISGATGATITNLAAAGTVNYIVVVQAPAAATAGQTNITTVTATPSGVVNTVAAPAAANATDTTVVVTGQVSLVKTQALDPTNSACSSAMDNVTAKNVTTLTFTQGQITQTGQTQPNPAGAGTVTVLPTPGNCIVYHVVATNVGTQNVNAVIISDSTPPNTTCFGTPFTPGGGAVVVSPASACTSNAAASVSSASVTLTPNATVDLYMRVKIAP